MKGLFHPKGCQTRLPLAKLPKSLQHLLSARRIKAALFRAEVAPAVGVAYQPSRDRAHLSRTSRRCLLHQQGACWPGFSPALGSVELQAFYYSSVVSSF